MGRNSRRVGIKSGTALPPSQDALSDNKEQRNQDRLRDNLKALELLRRAAQSTS